MKIILKIFNFFNNFHIFCKIFKIVVKLNSFLRNKSICYKIKYFFDKKNKFLIIFIAFFLKFGKFCFNFIFYLN